MHLKTIKTIIKKELILCIASLLAVVSCFFASTQVSYQTILKAIDFRTLVLLFCLMAVVAGFQQQGIFDRLGTFLIDKTKNARQVVIVLVGLCFFSSMLITNDVALITFVPFAFVVLDLFEEDMRKKLLLPVICMQTIAANLGSMLTPIGNPQNLYLYNQSQFTIPEFLWLMLPYTLASLGLLLIWIFLMCRKGAYLENCQAQFSPHTNRETNSKKLMVYCVLFFICILTILEFLDYPILFGIVVVTLLISERKLLLKIDYSLLLTFIAFFIFIGNLSKVPSFSSWLVAMLDGREVLVSILASQVLSNVPTALLLSEFTTKISDLIIGTNLGGLGTLIASMASLISFRFLANREPQAKGAYFLLFTVSNIILLVLLLGVWWIIG